MSSISAIVLAKTDEERDLARDALHKANAEAPSDREVVLDFLKDCTTLDGAPLTLDETGAVVVLQ